MIKKKPELLSSKLAQRGLVALVALVAVAAATPAALAQAPPRMQGRVVDENGNGLEGVQVIATNPDAVPARWEGESGANGRWALVGFDRGNWKFQFIKEGYITVEINATVTGAARNPDMDVTMEPMPDAASIAAGATASSVQPELFDEGTALYDAGDYAGAAAKWEEFLALNPQLHIVNGNIGNAYRQMGDIDKAQAAYEALLTIEPDNTMANYNVGEMLIEAGRPQEALPYFETVLANVTDDPAVYYNVAELYFSQRQMDQAIEYYRQALVIDPNYLSAHMQLGLALVRTGDNAGAVAAFEKYIELAPEDDPNLPLVRDLLAAIRFP